MLDKGPGVMLRTFVVNSMHIEGINRGKFETMILPNAGSGMMSVLMSKPNWFLNLKPSGTLITVFTVESEWDSISSAPHHARFIRPVRV